MWLKPYEDNNTGHDNTRYTYSMEGTQLLSDESTMYIRYIKRVTDVPTFDPLFVEVLVLQLALKMVMPLTTELYGTPRQAGIMSRVRAMDKSETRTIGRADRATWNDALMVGSGNPAKNYS
jgi:hypothetical protein